MLCVNYEGKYKYVCSRYTGILEDQLAFNDFFVIV